MAKKAAPLKPTADQIVDRWRDIVPIYARQDAEIDLLRRVRELIEIVALPIELERVKNMDMMDATITDEIFRARASLTVNDPKCVVTPGDPQEDEGQDNALLRSHWTQELLKEAGTRDVAQNTFEDIFDACLGDGGAWAKLLLDKHLWDNVWGVPQTEAYFADKVTGDEATDDTPADQVVKKTRSKSNRKYLDDKRKASRGAGVPVHFKGVDVRTVYPVWNGGRLVEMLEVSKRTVFDVLAEFGRGTDEEANLYGPPMSRDESTQYPRTCTFIEHWTPEYVTYVMGNEGTDTYASVGDGGNATIMKQVKHSYGFVPYYYAPGETMNHWKGRKKGWGIGWSKLSLVRYRAFVWKLVLNIAAQAAGTPIMHIRPAGSEPVDGDDQHPDGEVQTWELNGVYEGQPGETITPIPMPPVPPALLQLLEILDRMINELDTPRMNTNLGSNLDGAGFAIAQILTEAKTKFDPYVKHVQQLYRDVTRDLWKLLRDFMPDEEIFVHYNAPNSRSNTTESRWLSVVPSKDLTNDVGMHWEINPEPPTANIVKTRGEIEKINAGLTYLDAAIEATGGDPAEVRRGKIVDRLRNEGFVKDYQNTVYLQGLKAGDLLKKAADQAAQTGQMPGLSGPMQQSLGFGQPMAQPQGAAPGGPIIPDQGGLAASSGGVHAAPQGPGFPGGTPGAPAGAQGAPQMRLGPGG